MGVPCCRKRGSTHNICKQHDVTHFRIALYGQLIHGRRYRWLISYMTPLSDGTPAHMYGANKDSVCRSHLFCRRCYTAPKDGLFLYRPDGACNNVNSYLPVQFTLQLLHSSKPPICTGRPTEHCCVYMAEQNY